MKFSLLLVSTLLMVSNSFAGSVAGHDKDLYEKTFVTNKQRVRDAVYQQQLSHAASWQSFSERHQGWTAIFNEENQKPHRAYGAPIAVMTAGSAQATAMNFVRNELTDFNIPEGELKFETATFSKYQNIFFKQIHDGLEVLNSRLSVKMTTDNKVVSWSADVFDNIQVNTTPAIDEATAKNFATAGVPAVTGVSASTLRILPVPASHSYDFKLVYEMTVSADIPDAPAEYYTLVDASNGAVLYRHNKISFLDANASGTLYKVSLLTPATVQPLRNLKVDVGGSIYYTDSTGNVQIPGSSPVSATFSLEGLWSKTVTTNGTVSPSVTTIIGVGPISILFDTATTIRHLSAYYHVNIVHDFMKQYFPLFTTMDNPLPTRIDLTTGSCNAFYNGTSINFYATGNGCNSMAQIGDVIYHEYGHGISDQFYSSHGGSWDNGSMGEGYSDVWAMSITHQPVLGQGYRTSSSTAYIRRYDINKKVYPQDLTGEVHANGEIIAGAWYDTGLNMGSWADMTSLFTSTYYDLITAPDGDEGKLYTDILLSALQHDDNDADLTNGTPHAKQIIDAFALHGITLANALDVQHTQVLAVNASSPIVVNADLINPIPFLSTGSLTVFYQVNKTGPWNSSPMSVVSGNSYTASLPAQPQGTLVSYYIAILDTSGAILKTDPVEASLSDANIPYYVLVDYHSVKLEDFENSSSSWTVGIPSDAATSGIWDITSPLPSYNGTAVCQPGTQHTPGGNICAVTGNAGSITDAIGTNDVDGGATTLQSPVYDLTTYTSPAVAFWRYYVNDMGSTPRTDFWKVYASANGVNFVPVENIDVPDHSYRRFVFRVKDVLPGATQLTLRFVAEDAGSGSLVEAALDDVELLDVNSSIGITEHTSMPSLSVYPNPSHADMNVYIPAQGGSRLSLVNAVGQEVYAEQLSASQISTFTTISVKDFAAGVYRIVCTTNEGISHLNVVVQH